MLGLFFAPSAPALAEEALYNGAPQPTWLERHVTAYYLNWLTGMNTEAVSGNRDGTGTNLEDDHYLAFGPRFDKLTTLTLTLWGAQVLDETTADRNTNKQFQPSDPYLTLSRSSLLKSELYHANLDAYLRLYVPISRGTSDSLNSGTLTDYGRGMVRVYLSPSRTWFDRRLTFFANVYANYYVPVLTPDERFRRSTLQAAADGTTTPSSARQDFYFFLDPILDWAFSSKLDAYLEWGSGRIRHITAGQVTDATGTHSVSGHWTSIGDPTSALTGNYLSPGVNWSPTKRVFVNPYLQYQLSAVNSANPTKRRVSLFHADIGLQLQYTFN